MDKIIIFGRVYTFYSPKSKKDCFKIDYLTEDGEACDEFINQDSFYKINLKHLLPGTVVTAHYELNQWNRGEIVDCITD